ncbi:hypothetical protein AMATHDRAFT_50590 [Amanita thiersii Skay4041]|uniref:Uncharacterized protein n=1 Tax=Amanita thiersii Skay4041 TaxID=703135 RepID=A0A2A9NH58_9AGAR|nr:hypothetical protein AMATHDRAFT_50590 [Amanita thiersii Skay4041]
MPHPSTISGRVHAKLKKRRVDGYETDVGYVSDGKATRGKGSKQSGLVYKKNDNLAQKGADRQASAHSEREPVMEKGEKKKVKSFLSRGIAKESNGRGSPLPKGYETDIHLRKNKFSRRKKTRTGDVGYETDVGYFSNSTTSTPKKSRSRFFKLGSKSQQNDTGQSLQGHPDTLSIPLPIASKFGTTLGGETLPVLPPLPFLDTNLATSFPTPNSLSSTSSVSPLLSTPPPLSEKVSSLFPSQSSKGAVMDKRVRDSDVSGESYRSSMSTGSSLLPGENRSPGRRGFRFLSPSKFSTSSPSKFPAISLPITRAVSPAPANSQMRVEIIAQPSDAFHSSPSSSQFHNGPRPHTTPSSPTRCTASSSFLSPHSHQRPLSPTMFLPHTPPVIISSAPSPTMSPSVSRVSSLQPRYSPVRTSFNASLSPLPRQLPIRERSPSPIPSSEYIVPSPSAINILYQEQVNRSNPAVSSTVMFSHYDIPPPNPPPSVPLPRVPETSKDDEVLPDVFSAHGESLIRSLSCAGRGKDAPFPTKPILPSNVRPCQTKNNGDVDNKTGRDGKGLRGYIHERPDHDIYEGGQGLLDLLDRFEAISDPNDDQGIALDRNRSHEALPDILHADANVFNGGADVSFRADKRISESTFVQSRPRSSVYSDQQDAYEDRQSRWSESIYSRASFLDSTKSGEVRDRFVKRVEAMLDEAGLERGNRRRWAVNEVPPVPKLPEALAKSNFKSSRNDIDQEMVQ